MNRIDKVFSEKKNILSIYFTAGFPEVNDTVTIISELERSGADMIEIGMPFSDPLADGPTIQHSSEVALANGMTLKLLFEQLTVLQVSGSRSHVTMILMGYLNPVLQFGVENFCKRANECGISGIILPDLPMDEYLNEYKVIFDKYDLKNIFLITPQTSVERIRMIDEASDGFIYLVSSSATTGKNTGVTAETEKYFARIKEMKLKNRLMIGFGIHDRESFSKACEYANGAIIGSAFIKELETSGTKGISDFIKKIK